MRCLLKTLFFLYLILVPGELERLIAQEGGWVTVNDRDRGFGFRMPEKPDRFEEHGVIFYSQPLEGGEEAIVLQVHVSPGNELPAAPSQSRSRLSGQPDVLVQMAKYLLAVTGGELTTISDVVTSGGVAGKEVGVLFQDSDLRDVFLFMQAFYVGGRVFIFSIQAPRTQLETLVDYKNIFFKSIQINSGGEG